MTDVYDRDRYEAEDRRIMTAVARHVIGLVEAEQTSNVVSWVMWLRPRRLQK